LISFAVVNPLDSCRAPTAGFSVAGDDLAVASQRRAMPLTADDRSAIAELISLHGHLFDEGELDRLDELFTGDVVCDVRDFGQEPLRGIDAIREAALKLGGANR
jgi:hypothetical protein